MGFMALLYAPLLPNVCKLLVIAAVLACSATRNATLWPQIRTAKVESWERGTKHGGRRRSSGGNFGANHILERWALAGPSGRASQQKPTGSGRIPEAVLPTRPAPRGQGEAGVQPP